MVFFRLEYVSVCISIFISACVRVYVFICARVWLYVCLHVGIVHVCSHISTELIHALRFSVIKIKIKNTQSNFPSLFSIPLVHPSHATILNLLPCSPLFKPQTIGIGTRYSRYLIYSMHGISLQ